MQKKTSTGSEFLLGLSGSLWPLHIKPHENELFSSWLIRFAHVHRMKAETICTLLFGYRSSIWNRGIDKLCPLSILDKMIEVTGAEQHQAKNTFLESYQGLLSLTYNKNGNTRWILPLGINHRARSRPGLMYCPLCLKSESPYFRKLWRLAWVTVCTEHKTVLMNTCQKCGAYIVPHRSDFFAKNSIPDEETIICCFGCGALLSSFKNKSADKLVLKWQYKMEHALNDGYISWCENSSLYSFLFFDGVRELAQCLLKDLIPRDGLVKQKREFEFIDLSLRYEIMKRVARILNDWPISFVRYVFDSKSSYSYLRNYDSVSIPFWYEREIKLLTKKYSDISKEEAEAIKNYTVKTAGRFNMKKARLLSGRDISGHI